MFVTLSGMVMLVRLEQSRNIRLEIEVIPEPITTFVRKTQSSNVPVSLNETTVSGITIDVIDDWKKAFYGIVVTLDGQFTFFGYNTSSSFLSNRIPFMTLKFVLLAGKLITSGQHFKKVGPCPWLLYVTALSNMESSANVTEDRL